MTKNSLYMIVVLAIVNTITSCVNYRELQKQRALNNALMGIISSYYNNLDNEYDAKGNVINMHPFFDDAVTSTDDYYIADSLLNHNLEKIIKK